MTLKPFMFPSSSKYRKWPFGRLVYPGGEGRSTAGFEIAKVNGSGGLRGLFPHCAREDPTQPNSDHKVGGVRGLQEGPSLAREIGVLGLEGLREG